MFWGVGVYLFYSAVLLFNTSIEFFKKVFVCLALPIMLLYYKDFIDEKQRWKDYIA